MAIKKYRVRMPSVTVIARGVQDASASVDKRDCGEEGCDIRLQVYPNEGGWQIHIGDSSYDQDHRGYWGAASVPGGRISTVKALEIAKELIEQAADQAAQNDELEE